MVCLSTLAAGPFLGRRDRHGEAVLHGSGGLTQQPLTLTEQPRSRGRVETNPVTHAGGRACDCAQAHGKPAPRHHTCCVQTPAIQGSHKPTRPVLCPFVQIRNIRLKGGDVILSFGGASGQELAQVISNEDALVRPAACLALHFLFSTFFCPVGGCLASHCCCPAGACQPASLSGCDRRHMSQRWFVSFQAPQVAAVPVLDGL